MTIVTGGGIALALAATIFFLSQSYFELSTPNSGSADDEGFFHVPERPRTDDGMLFRPDWD
jgi:hypothetical protein